jgi:hypothetical protein
MVPIFLKEMQLTVICTPGVDDEKEVTPAPEGLEM